MKRIIILLLLLCQLCHADHTTLGHKFGFGPARKLPGFNDCKRVNISNMDPFTIVESRGFGAVQIPSLWPSVVYKYNLSVCAIFQDEAPYLKEWIEFHRLVGVEHFYLYNHCSSDEYAEVLKPYLAAGVVELTDIKTPGPDFKTFNNLQIGCYSECLNHARGVTKWLAILDIDEFLFPVKEESLLTFLKGYEEFGAVCANWLLFGTSGHKKIPEGQLLIESLTRCAAGSFRENLYVKSIVRPERASHFMNPHCPVFYEDHFQVNTDKLPFDGLRSEYHQINKLRINHYWTRDEDYFYRKKIPRQQRWGGTPKPECLIQNMNCGQDDLILRYVPALKKAMSN